MSELSRMMDKHANPEIWRESHGGWVGVMYPKIELFFIRLVKTAYTGH